MQIVIDNLFNNAWKFTSKHPMTRIEFNVLNQNETQVFFIRDDGAGFDLTHVNKLFVPFQRLHGTDEFEGTGIGLVTVQRIIHRHGGRIWAEGAVGAGATFYFTLPR
jgi:light-regulated signal transduction histidine kinase (bacteriophytochrome)